MLLIIRLIYDSYRKICGGQDDFLLFFARDMKKNDYLCAVLNDETIRLEQLSIGYHVKKTVKTVAADINASVFRRQLTCLIGANGVGKSTLLRTLTAFQPKLSGRIMMRDSGGEMHETGSLSDRELARMVSVVLTERPAIENMTVWELVSMGRSPYTNFWGRLGADDRRITDEAIATTGIEVLRNRLVNTLSDGERQKVMMAKALAQQTPIICLDEPTAFLDFPSKVETMLMLRRISREADKTVFLSTHDMELALQTADTIWLMDREQGLCIGSPQQLARDGVLSRFIDRPGICFDNSTMTVKIQAL